MAGCAQLVHKQFESTRDKIKLHHEYLTPRNIDLLADAQHRNEDYTEGDLDWIGNIPSKMSATIKSRKHPGQTATCHMERVKTAPNGRVKIKCTCDYVKIDGFCDHALLMCEIGGAAHPHELFPWTSTTACWRWQYHLNTDGTDSQDVSFMHAPTYDEVMACDGTTHTHSLYVQHTFSLFTAHILSIYSTLGSCRCNRLG